MILSIGLHKKWKEFPAGLSSAGLFHSARLLVSVSQEKAAEALQIDGVRAADESEVDAWCAWANARATPRPAARRTNVPSPARKGGPLAAHWRCTPERDD